MRRGDASALEDEVAQKVWSAQCGDTSAVSACHDEVVKRVAARGSTPQDSALEDEVAWRIIAARDSNNTDEASAQREEHHDNTGKTSHDGALVSACEDFHDISGQTGHDGALVSVHEQHDHSSETQNNQPKTLASPSSLAAFLSMLPTPKRES